MKVEVSIHSWILESEALEKTSGLKINIWKSSACGC